MDRLFLDANVLFSAAYRPDAGVLVLWSLKHARLVSSAYAVEEARRNLRTAEQLRALDELLETVAIVEHHSTRQALPEGPKLPAKDEPILVSAIEAGCTHLLTGDVRHFGPYFNQRVAGVLILRPAAYVALTSR